MRRFLAEWEPQDAVMLTWPHMETDWAEVYDRAVKCFIQLAETILSYENLLIVAQNSNEIKAHFKSDYPFILKIVELETNDTWARDHGPLCVSENGVLKLLDFKFNGWGEKYAWEKDNEINAQLKKLDLLKCELENHLGFVFEGGAIDTNGKGVGITTSKCVFNRNRNPNLSNDQVINKIKSSLGLDDLIVLNHGGLIGDDTDAHIDTLVRFVNEDTLVYVKCSDQSDPHYDDLKLMEEELEKIASRNKLKIVGIPHANPMFDEDRRLPATYLNFLFINGALLIPTYSNDDLDRQVLNLFGSLVPDREVIGIDSSILVYQNGSLHCSTMQLPQGVLNLN